MNKRVQKLIEKASRGRFDKFLEERDRDIYTPSGICDSLESDGISASEEGFMMGYMGW